MIGYSKGSGKLSFPSLEPNGLDASSEHLPHYSLYRMTIEGAFMDLEGSTRNALCMCGSGRKFKHCHGSLADSDASDPFDSFHALQHAEMEARRKADQGMGREIVSLLLADGRRVLAVGGRRMIGRWGTFPDFLMDYIKGLFEADWGNEEIGKPEAERHPLIALYQRVCARQRDARVGLQPGAVAASAVTGADSLFFGLAYNLYCIEHNARIQPNWKRWLHRLKTKTDFYATCYEAYAAASFVRAGFVVDFFDEGEPGKKPEFLAQLPETGRILAVECKRRAHDVTDKNNEVQQLNRAIDQNHTGHSLVTFIELARPFLYDGGGALPDVLRNAVGRLDRHAATALGKSQGPVYVMLTNQPQIHFLDGGVGLVGYLHGFNIPELGFKELGPIEELLDSRDAHPEIFQLLRSMQKHNHVPNSFNASEPRQDSGLRTLLDCFDFYFDAYRMTPREQLVEWMKEWPDRFEFSGLDQARLARRYASHFALIHWSQMQSGRGSGAGGGVDRLGR